MAKKQYIPLATERPIVLGWDPGVWNCALAAYSADGLEATDVIEGATDHVRGLAAFSDRVERQFDWYQPDACAVERYQQRRGKKGGNNFVGKMELVNIMIGIIFRCCKERGIHCALVTPATHKKWAGKNNGATKRSGTLAMDTCPEFQHLRTEHEADAANVAKYVLVNVFGITPTPATVKPTQHFTINWYRPTG